jgi:hypothetical protein
MRKLLFLILTGLLSLVVTNLSLSDTHTSIANGNWGTSSTWSPASVPSSTDDVIINTNVNVNGIYTTRVCNNLTVNAGRTLTINNSSSLQLTVNGTFIVGAGAIVNVGGASGGRLVITGTGKTHSISGNINIYWALRFDYPSGTSTSTVTVNSGAIITTDHTAMGQLCLDDGLDMTVASGAEIINNCDISTSGLQGINLVSGGNSQLIIDGTLTNGIGGSIMNGGTITINGLFNYPSGVWSTNALSYGVAGTLAYVGGALTTTTYEWPASNSPYNVKINSTGNITLNSARTINGTLSLMQSQLVKGTYALTMGNGATIDRSGGTISAAPTFGTTVNIIYSGTNAITTGAEVPVSISVLNNLTINTSSGVTLSNTMTINGTLTLSNGNINTSTLNLLFGANATNPEEKLTSHILGTAIMNGRNIGTSSLEFLGVYFHPSANNLANLSLTRKTGTAYSSNGKNGINCSWNITSTNPPSSGINLDFIWLSAHDNLHFFTSTNGGVVWKSMDSGNNWSAVGTPQNVSGSDPRRIINIPTTSFFIWTISSEDIPMPVELAFFTSNVISRDVKLNWITATETNNAGFEIQKSEIRSQKQEEWVKVGYINGNGTKTTPTNYTFEEKKLNLGKYNYRLKQIDYNGNFEYHNLNGIIEIGVPNKFNISQNYPNPFNPTTKIDFELPYDSKVSIKLYDIRGREVMTIMNDQRPAGYYTEQMNGNNLSSGTYFYRINAEGNGQNYVMTKKAILIK